MLRAAAPCKGPSLPSVSEDILFGKATSHGEKIFTSDIILKLFFHVLDMTEGGSECCMAHRPRTNAFEC
jgi:hypothetical protein